MGRWTLLVALVACGTSEGPSERSADEAKAQAETHPRNEPVDQVREAAEARARAQAEARARAEPASVPGDTAGQELCPGARIPDDLRRCERHDDCKAYADPRGCRSVGAREDAMEAIAAILAEHCPPHVPGDDCLGSGFETGECVRGICEAVDSF